MKASPTVRRSARLLIVSRAGSLLLFKYHDEHQDPFWATVGGELLEGEDYRSAAARELFEETGSKGSIGRVVQERDEIYSVARAGPARWLERYFLVECGEEFQPADRGWSEEERFTIQEWQWWSPEQLQDAGVVFLPEWLPSVLGEILQVRAE